MVVTVSGMTTLFNLGQFLNDPNPIFFKSFGNVILCKFSIPAKASIGVSSIPSLTMIELALIHFESLFHLSGISLTFEITNSLS